MLRAFKSLQMIVFLVKGAFALVESLIAAWYCHLALMVGDISNELVYPKFDKKKYTVNKD